MGIIGSLRKHSGWAVGFVAVAIIAFIIGDMTKNQRGEPAVMKVNNASLSHQHLEELENEEEANYAMNYNKRMSDRERRQAYVNVCQRFSEETLLGEQMDKMGLQVTPAELSDMYTGTFIHPYLRQNFTNPQTGQYDYAGVSRTIDEFESIEDTAFRLRWVEMEKLVRRDRETQKYSNMIMGGFYMPTAIAAKVADLSKETATARVVMLPYQNVSDEDAVPTDADYKAYYEKHKAEFKNSAIFGIGEEVREIEYVAFPTNPTPEDLADIENEVKSTWEEMQTIAEDELTYYVSSVSDKPYDSTYKKADEYAAPINEMLANAKEGDMISPLMAGNQWLMGKVLSIAMRPDSLHARSFYILNNLTQQPGIFRTDDEAKHLADSVANLVNTKKMTFDEALRTYTDGQKENFDQYDMGWALDGQYGIFNEGLVNNAVGSCFVVKEPGGYGYYLCEVNEKTVPNKKYRVAIINRQIMASSNTYRNINKIADQFAAQNRTAEELEAAAREQNVEYRSVPVISVSDSVPGLSNTREFIRWAFDSKTKAGMVSDKVYECNGTFVVVAVKEVYKKEGMTLEQVRGMQELSPSFDQRVLLEKKGDVLMARAKEVGSAKTIDDISTKFSAPVDTLRDVAFNSYFLGRFGMEPKLQSAIVRSGNGLIGPVRGATGVYLVQVDGKTPRETAVDPNLTKAQLEQGYRNKMRAIMQVLSERAKVVDNRVIFF